MSAVRASALFTFIRPAPPLRGISGEYITIKKHRLQIKLMKKRGRPPSIVNPLHQDRSPDGEFHSLHGQQRPFHLAPPLITAYFALRPHRPMTGDNDRERVRRQRPPDRPAASRRPDLPCDPPICADPAPWYSIFRKQDPPLELPARLQRDHFQIEGDGLALEKALDPLPEFDDPRGRLPPCLGIFFQDGRRRGLPRPAQENLSDPRSGRRFPPDDAHPPKSRGHQLVEGFFDPQIFNPSKSLIESESGSRSA